MPSWEINYLIRYFSYIDEYIPWSNGVLDASIIHDHEDDIPHMYNCCRITKEDYDKINRVLVATKDKKLIKEYSIGALLTAEQIKKLLDIEGLIKDGRLLIFESNSDEYSALFKEGDHYFYFNDWMNPKKELRTTSLDQIVAMLCKHHPGYMGSVVGDENLELVKYFPLGLKIFAFHEIEEKIEYPNPRDILDIINPVTSVLECSSLNMAARVGSLETVQYFLTKGANPNSEDTDGTTPLMVLSRRGDIAMVEALILAGADPNIQNKCGDTALLFATRYNHLEIVKMLLMARANPNIQNLEKQVPLMHASKYGYVEIVKAILMTRNNINIRCWNDSDALALATRYNWKDIVKLLIEAKFNVNMKKDDKHGWTPLIYAAREGNVELLEMLLNSGADLEPQSNDGTTALMMASINSRVEIVKKLIKCGAKLDAQDKDGWTALMYAAEYDDNGETVRVLLAAGANPNSVITLPTFRYKPSYTEAMREHSANESCADYIKRKSMPKTSIDDVTALMMAVYRGKKGAIKVLLEDARVDVNLRNGDGDTALIMAVKCDNCDCVKILLANGADLNAKDNDGCTALIHAITSGHVGIFKELLSFNADPKVLDNFGASALMHAAIGRQAMIVDQLISIGVDPNIQCKHGWTAIMGAASYNNSELIKKLINAGADINIQNEDGDTALIIAAIKGYTDFVRELLLNYKLNCYGLTPAGFYNSSFACPESSCPCNLT